MPDADTSTSQKAGLLQWGARLGLVLVLVALGVAVLSPSSGGPDALLSGFADRMAKRGVSRSLTDVTRLEVIANVAIVVPIGALGALAFPRLRWQDWAAYAFVGAVVVELIQGVLLPEREMSATDVVANTAGALIGAIAVALLRRSQGPSKV